MCLKLIYFYLIFKTSFLSFMKGALIMSTIYRSQAASVYPQILAEEDFVSTLCLTFQK